MRQGGPVRSDPLYVDAWGRLLRLHAEVVARIEADLHQHGLIPLTWYDVLLALENAPRHRLRLSEVAEKIVLSRSALTRSAARLIEEGYLRREPCAEDERGAYAILTKKGKEALARARPVYWAAIRKYFAAALSDDETRTLEGILGRIVAHLPPR